MTVGALFFPGENLLRPYGKVRDSIALMQKPRFRLLPFEWHLAWFMADTTEAIIDLEPAGKALRLSEMNPTFDRHAYFMEKRRHRVALITREETESIIVRVAARTNGHRGWVRSGPWKIGFTLLPHESRLIAVRPALRGHAFYRRSEVYCYMIEFVTEDPLEDNAIYPADYYSKLGPFLDWLPDDAQPSTGPATIEPDNPLDGGRLLWGWHAPESPDDAGMRVRWSGEATESALLVSRDRSEDLLLRVWGECPVPISTEVIWNGHLLGERTIGPGETAANWPVGEGLVRSGENTVYLRHDRLWSPAELTNNPEGDKRRLAVRYRQISIDPAPASLE